jgi:hypothetical protein
MTSPKRTRLEVEAEQLLHEYIKSEAFLAGGGFPGPGSTFEHGAQYGFKRALELAEKVAHREEPEHFSGDQTFGYLHACEDFIRDIRALATEEEP